MAQERPVTPEKQLLKLIEARPEDLAASSKARIVKRRGLSLFSPGAWLGRISFFKDSYKKKIKASKGLSLDIKIFNRALAAAFVVLFIYLVMEVSASMISLKDMPVLDVQPHEAIKAMPAAGIELLGHDTSYISKIRQRDIFRMGVPVAPRQVQQASQAAKPPTSAIIEATAHLRLVGISWSDDPYAMIEDTRALRTFFVRRGQSIDRVTVEAVFKDKIVLSYGGEEVELK